MSNTRRLKAPEGCGSAAVAGVTYEVDKEGCIEVESQEAVDILTQPFHGFTFAPERAETPNESRKKANKSPLPDPAEDEGKHATIGDGFDPAAVGKTLAVKDLRKDELIAFLEAREVPLDGDENKATLKELAREALADDEE